MVEIPLSVVFGGGVVAGGELETLGVSDGLLEGVPMDDENDEKEFEKELPESEEEMEEASAEELEDTSCALEELDMSDGAEDDEETTALDEDLYIKCQTNSGQDF